MTTFMTADYSSKRATTLKENAETKVTELGSRKILSQNFSKLVTLQKNYLVNACTGQEAKFISVQWIQEKEVSYFKLTPIYDNLEA